VRQPLATPDRAVFTLVGAAGGQRVRWLLDERAWTPMYVDFGFSTCAGIDGAATAGLSSHPPPDLWLWPDGTRRTFGSDVWTLAYVFVDMLTDSAMQRAAASSETDVAMVRASMLPPRYRARPLGSDMHAWLEDVDEERTAATQLLSALHLAAALGLGAPPAALRAHPEAAALVARLVQHAPRGPTAAALAHVAPPGSPLRDLLAQMLAWPPYAAHPARDALMHAYFAPLREAAARFDAGELPAAARPVTWYTANEHALLPEVDAAYAARMRERYRRHEYHVSRHVDTPYASAAEVHAALRRQLARAMNGHQGRRVLRNELAGAREGAAPSSPRKRTRMRLEAEEQLSSDDETSTTSSSASVH
jgi:hypothetical protein